MEFPEKKLQCLSITTNKSVKYLVVMYYSKQWKSEVELDIKGGTELSQLFRVSE